METPKNPTNPKPAPPKPNDEFTSHRLDKDILKNSAKDIGLVNEPIHSLSPVSGEQSDTNEIKILTDVSILIGDDEQEDYPYEKLKLDQGFFIPTQPNDTTDNLLAKLIKSIDKAKKRYGQIEVDENGDEVWEVVTIRTKKRNDDGTIQMHGNELILGAEQHQRPKYQYTRNYIAKPVAKGQEIGENVKAEGDGVIVIRTA